jgi:hypothetical protein
LQVLPKHEKSMTEMHSKLSIQQEIETALKPLIGEPLSDMRRAGFQMFEIGVQKPCKNRKGQDITRADMALHVSCDWYITRKSDQILSSEDFGPEWGERRDEKAEPFYQGLGAPDYIITSISADDSGGVVIQMAGGYTLQIICTSDSEVRNLDGGPEQWRFLPKDESAPHFVVTAEGIER